MKTWTKVLIIIMGVFLSGSVGMNITDVKSDVDITQAVLDQFKNGVVEVINSEVPGMLKPLADDIDELKSGLNSLKQTDIDDKTGRAISAYSKVFTIEDLKDSPEKRFSISQGLQIESCYDILLTMDHDRTLLFYQYLIGDSF